MQATKFKFTKNPVTSITRPTQLGEKVLDGGKSLLRVAIAATVSAIFTAILRDSINTNVKDVRDYSRQTFQYVKNECKAKD